MDIFGTIELIPLEHFVFFSFALFAIGMIGVMVRKNAIVILLCVELMLNAVNILLVAFSVYHNDPSGQILVFFVMALAAAEAAIGLAIIVMVYRNHKTLDVNLLNRLNN